VNRRTGGARHTAITQAHLEETEEMAEEMAEMAEEMAEKMGEALHVFTTYNKGFGGRAVGSMDDYTMEAIFDLAGTFSAEICVARHIFRFKSRDAVRLLEMPSSQGEGADG
jgi:hypothetical protein